MQDVVFQAGEGAVHKYKTGAGSTCKPGWFFYWPVFFSDLPARLVVKKQVFTWMQN